MNIKKIVSIVLLLLALSMALASCNFSGIEPNPPASDGESGGETPENPENPSNPENPEDGAEVPEEQKTLTYEEYINLTAEEQKDFIYSFSDMTDFFLWHEEAKAKYDEEHKPPVIDGDINIGDLLGPQE